ncbi:MAG: Rrf2 family transcriptional regulator [Bacteroidetes bacterium]|jgi:Rrf2 family protein|nr:Rrf2 family transcriptional regulator [Bacteroidota bacterium]
MFSKSSEYAIRAAIYISAESSLDKKVGISEICEHILAPQHFTAKIMQILTRHHIVSSQKGVNGGYYLNREQHKIKLIEIISAVDGDSLFAGCVLGLDACSETEPCPLHQQYKTIRSGMKTMMEKSTIGAMASKLKRGRGFLRSA